LESTPPRPYHGIGTAEYRGLPKLYREKTVSRRERKGAGKDELSLRRRLRERRKNSGFCSSAPTSVCWENSCFLHGPPE